MENICQEKEGRGKTEDDQTMRRMGNGRWDDVEASVRRGNAEEMKGKCVVGRLIKASGDG